MGSAGLSRRGERRLVEVKRVRDLPVKALMRPAAVVEREIARNATFALNAAEWLRRGRLIFFAPWRLRRLLEQNFTYTPVRFCGATSLFRLDPDLRNQLTPSLIVGPHPGGELFRRSPQRKKAE